MDQRQDTLSQWAADQIEQLYRHSIPAEMITVSGDASFRRYFRIIFTENGVENSWIAVDAPPEHENSCQFVEVSKVWSAAGVKVPTVLAFDEARGFMLLEDFGDTLLYPELNDNTADELYRAAIDALLSLQQLPRTDNIPQYDRALLDQEMALFQNWLCEQHLSLILTDTEKTMLANVFETLAKSALAQPQVMVHRDYHSRNLMVCTGDRRTTLHNQIGIIDFQDAVWGAYTYDLVSLLKDCYIEWPRPQVLAWLEYFASSSDVFKDVDGESSAEKKAQLVRDFDLMGMQRHLKAAGIFARLSIRDNKHGYLNDLPRTCGYLLKTAKLYSHNPEYPEFSVFADWLQQRFLPALQQQTA